MPMQKYDRYTVECKGEDNFVIYGWSTYGKGSVLEGQPMKCFIDTFETQDDALKEYPTATPSNKWMEPQNTFNHLPGEDDPVSGGMYPDDI